MSCKAHEDIKKRLTLAITGEGHPVHTYIPQLRNTGCNKTRQKGALIGHILHWFIKQDTMNENEYNTYVKGNYDTVFNESGRKGLKENLRRFPTSRGVTPWLKNIQNELESDIAVFENTTATIRITKVWKKNIIDVAVKLFGNCGQTANDSDIVSQLVDPRPCPPSCKLQQKQHNGTSKWDRNFWKNVRNIINNEYVNMTDDGIVKAFYMLTRQCRLQTKVQQNDIYTQKKVFRLLKKRINQVGEQRFKFNIGKLADEDIGVLGLTN
jgi:hypothetical protein